MTDRNPKGAESQSPPISELDQCDSKCDQVYWNGLNFNICNLVLTFRLIKDTSHISPIQHHGSSAEDLNVTRYHCYYIPRTTSDTFKTDQNCIPDVRWIAISGKLSEIIDFGVTGTALSKYGISLLQHMHLLF